MVADDSTADVIRRGWAAVSEQPLTIEVMGKGSRLDSFDVDQLLEAAKKSDILWVPHFAIPDLVAAGGVDSFKDDSTLDAVNAMLPAIRNGLTQYAGEVHCIPLGPTLPVVMSVDSVASIQSWQGYDKAVTETWKGKAAEPTSEGWAGMMFLWRCGNIVDRWLFDQNNFDPLITGDDYVAVLEQMKQTHDRYEIKDLSPSEITAMVAGGELRGGISYPIDSQSSNSSALDVTALPRRVDDKITDDVEEALRATSSSEHFSVLFDAMTPVLAISASCRQTASSKTFISWITGGESSGNSRRELPAVFPNTPRIASSESSDGFEYAATRDRILAQPLTLPGLTVLNAPSYYQAIDHAVRACLYQDQPAKNALAEAASTWSKLTDEIGMQQQLKAWRRSRGLRA
ncbi:hypothetical protein Pla22_01190 [Rubripirellula amarantea]|uniref:Bacterial extracellular solute-binding protein n=2 Tax=Rubripirellula amarantea TaxID=2527999 RepID=A0A5C5WQD9_9BACT|nr:hypothetical protein Pla22_01190 [Rubripirellula amarantea]